MVNLKARTIILGVLVILGIVLGFLFVYHFLNEIILIFMGIVLSITIAPAVDFLHAHHLNRSLSVIVIYLIPLALLLALVFLVIPQMVQQISGITPSLGNLYTTFFASIQNSPYTFIRQWSATLPHDINAWLALLSAAGQNNNSPFNMTLGFARNVLFTLFELAVVLLVGFYWTLEGEKAQYAFSLLFPVENREKTRDVISDIEQRVGGFVRGQGLLALAIGGMVLISYSLIGLPSVLSLAFLAGVCELIPVFGPTLGAFPAVLLAFASNPVKVFWVIPVTIFLQMFENHFLAPQIMKKVVNVNPIVTILAITAFGYLAGFTGILMAIPLAAIIQVLLDRSLLRPEKNLIEQPVGRGSLSKLHYDVQEYMQDVRKLVRNKETNDAPDAKDDMEDSLESIAATLDELLVQALPPEEKEEI